MKCPKCGYIGFDTGERCRNCGYEFALAEDLSPPEDRLQADRAVPDLDLGGGPRGPRGGRRAGSTPAADSVEPLGEEDDLPLFGDPSAAAAGYGHPAVRPPLAVRRPAAPPPRMRPRTPARQEPEVAELELVAEAAPETPAPAPDAPPAAPVAPAVRRLVAATIDVLLLGGIDATVLYFTLRLCRLGLTDVTLLPVAPLAAFLVFLNGGYLMVFTAVGGQTIGKMAAGIKVVDESGSAVRFGQAAARTLACLLTILTLGLGFVPALFARQRRALHDRLTNTRVVRFAP